MTYKYTRPLGSCSCKDCDEGKALAQLELKLGEQRAERPRSYAYSDKRASTARRKAEELGAKLFGEERPKSARLSATFYYESEGGEILRTDLHGLTYDEKTYIERECWYERARRAAWNVPKGTPSYRVNAVRNEQLCAVEAKRQAARTVVWPSQSGDAPIRVDGPAYNDDAA